LRGPERERKNKNREQEEDRSRREKKAEGPLLANQRHGPQPHHHRQLPLSSPSTTAPWEIEEENRNKE
jgi:hypothetical protein